MLPRPPLATSKHADQSEYPHPITFRSNLPQRSVCSTPTSIRYSRCPTKSKFGSPRSSAPTAPTVNSLSDSFGFYSRKSKQEGRARGAQTIRSAYSFSRDRGSCEIVLLITLSLERDSGSVLKLQSSETEGEGGWGGGAWRVHENDHVETTIMVKLGES